MIRPLPFAWPYWPAFWLVFFWAYLPEFRIIRAAKLAAARADSQDAGSVAVIERATGLASLVAFALAWVGPLRAPAALQGALYLGGIVTLIAGSLLRRHCWRKLGTSFTGDVRARPDQAVVTTGAYAVLRHPSYTAGILMNAGIGLALGSWGSVTLLVTASVVAYRYRMAVEERVLLATIGEPYREFMRTRRRLIPFLY